METAKTECTCHRGDGHHHPECDQWDPHVDNYEDAEAAKTFRLTLTSDDGTILDTWKLSESSDDEAINLAHALARAELIDDIRREMTAALAKGRGR